MKKLLLALVLVSVGEVMADALPKGPYLQNCYDCTFVSNVLKCRCHDLKGGRNDSSLKVNPEERRMISNQDGILTFILPPNGDYLKSCSNCKIDEKNLLKCDCKTENGSINASSLEINPGEMRPIGNDNGRLYFILPLPEGQYKNVCWDCTYKNDLLTCTCKAFRFQSPTYRSSVQVTPGEKTNIGVTSDSMLMKY